MSLTYGGRLGIGITNPANTIHVVGTSTVTGNSWFGGDVNVVGNISVGVNVTGNNVASEAQKVFAISGVSTFYDVFISNDLDILGSVGIGTTVPIAALDVRNETGLFGSIGIGTTAVNGTFRVYGTTTLETVAVGNTTGDNASGVGIYDVVTLLSGGIVSGINSLGINLDATCSIGIGSTEQRSAIDFSGAGKNYFGSDGAYMIVPTLTSTERAGLTTYAGGIIYNSTSNEFQGSVGVNTSWINLGITTSNINSDKIDVGPGVTIKAGVVTATNGFNSGIGTAVQITTVGNRIVFTVPGVGTTSLQLF
jgi:hypothetical protein